MNWEQETKRLYGVCQLLQIENAELKGKIERLQQEHSKLIEGLAEIKQLLNEDRENDGAFQSWNHMQAWKVATQALSTVIGNIFENPELLKGDGNE